MNLIGNIRSLYTPLQPCVKRSTNEVIYQEHLPIPELQTYIYCYWELKTTKKLDSPFTYRVVTDGCIDIFFEMSKASENYVMGFCKKYTEFPLDNSFHYVGVRFLPTAFPQIFKIDASLLSNQFQSLANVSEVLSYAIADNFDIELDSQTIVNRLDDILFECVNATNFINDDRFYSAINLILENYGVINIEADIQTGLSQRQLRRLFKYYIGDSPKSFSRVVRFQNILKAKPSSQSLRQNKLFYDLGYFDQAHFIKDFKNFYGVTPSKAFGRG